MSKKKNPANTGEELGRLVLPKDSIPNPTKLGDYFEKFLLTLYRLELYDSTSVSAWRVGMPDNWHIVFRQMLEYFKIVKKSRKKPRVKRTGRK